MSRPDDEPLSARLLTTLQLLGGLVATSLWDGYKEDGVVGAVNSLNPIFHFLRAGVDTKLAWDAGDYRAAGKSGVNVVASGASIVGGVAGIVGKASLGANAVGAAAAGEASAASRILQFTSRDLQKGFTKHGADFGMTGTWNPSRAGDFSRAINKHINDPVVVETSGTYRGGIPVTHHFNPSTGVNVIVDSGGNYVSG